MKKGICLFAALLMLSGCSAPEAPVESQTESIAAVSSQQLSSQTASSAPEISSQTPASSEAVVSPEAEEASSEAVSSAPASSEAASSEILPPVESEEIPELVCPLASSQTEAPASSQTQPPASSEAVSSAPPASSTVSEYVVPEDERPMTDAEVDALIAEAIAYAESKGMTWYDEFSLSNDVIGYNPPGHSEWGYRACKETVFYNIDDLYQLAVTDNFYAPGNNISYKIEKGRIDSFEGWFIYVLY